MLNSIFIDTLHPFYTNFTVFLPWLSDIKEKMSIYINEFTNGGSFDLKGADGQLAAFVGAFVLSVLAPILILPPDKVRKIKNENVKCLGKNCKCEKLPLENTRNSTQIALSRIDYYYNLYYSSINNPILFNDSDPDEKEYSEYYDSIFAQINNLMSLDNIVRDDEDSNSDDEEVPLPFYVSEKYICKREVEALKSDNKNYLEIRDINLSAEFNFELNKKITKRHINKLGDKSIKLAIREKLSNFYKGIIDDSSDEEAPKKKIKVENNPNPNPKTKKVNDADNVLYSKIESLNDDKPKKEFKLLGRLLTPSYHISRRNCPMCGNKGLKIFRFKVHEGIDTYSCLSCFNSINELCEITPKLLAKRILSWYAAPILFDDKGRFIQDPKKGNSKYNVYNTAHLEKL